MYCKTLETKSVRSSQDLQTMQNHARRSLLMASLTRLSALLLQSLSLCRPPELWIQVGQLLHLMLNVDMNQTEWQLIKLEMHLGA